MLSAFKSAMVIEGLCRELRSWWEGGGVDATRGCDRQEDPGVCGGLAAVRPERVKE